MVTNFCFSAKFGLYQVNFTDPERTRTPRASASYYKNIIKTNSLDVEKPSVDERHVDVTSEV